GVQIGEDGALLVDSGGSGQGQRLLSAISPLTNRAIRFLLNTNADVDHVSGNGTIVTSQRGTRGPSPGGGGGGNAQPQNVGVVSVAHENAFNRMQSGSRGGGP